MFTIFLDQLLRVSNNLAQQNYVQVIGQLSRTPNYPMIMYLVNYSRDKQ